jgi:hypothetical protein
MKLVRSSVSFPVPTAKELASAISALKGWKAFFIIKNYYSVFHDGGKLGKIIY